MTVDVDLDISVSRAFVPDEPDMGAWSIKVSAKRLSQDGSDKNPQIRIVR